MRRILFAICIALLLLCCSCGLFSPQRYVCDVENVASIQIVRIDNIEKGQNGFEYTVLSQIPDCETFVRNLNEVKHSVNWGDPYPMEVYNVVVKIEYNNGDFDLIHPDSQYFSKAGNISTGYFFFDDEQFNDLISSYYDYTND